MTAALFLMNAAGGAAFSQLAALSKLECRGGGVNSFKLSFKVKVLSTEEEKTMSLCNTLIMT